MHERRYEGLMLALHGAGRRSEALDVYRQAWRALRKERGIDPAPHLGLLHRQILAHTPIESLLEASPGTWKPVKTTPPRRAATAGPGSTRTVPRP